MKTSNNCYKSLLALGAGVAVMAVAALTTPSAMATCTPNTLQVTVVPSKTTVVSGETITFNICIKNISAAPVFNFAMSQDFNGDQIDDVSQTFGQINAGEQICFSQPFTVTATAGCMTNVVNVFGGSTPVCEQASAVICVSGDGGGGGCTYTQGFWKNHASAWPVSSLVIGGNTYTKAELLAIFRLPPKGDASLILMHQLIAAKLNYAKGSQHAGTVDTAITTADALLAQCTIKVPCGIKASSVLGAKMVVQSVTLDAYNNGLLTLAGHCD